MFFQKNFRCTASDLNAGFVDTSDVQKTEGFPRM